MYVLGSLYTLSLGVVPDWPKFSPNACIYQKGNQRKESIKGGGKNEKKEKKWREGQREGSREEGRDRGKLISNVYKNPA